MPELIKQFSEARHSGPDDLSVSRRHTCEYCVQGVRHIHQVKCGTALPGPENAPSCPFCDASMEPARVDWETHGWLFTFRVQNVPGYACARCEDKGESIGASILSALFAVAAAHYRRGGQEADAVEKGTQAAAWEAEAVREGEPRLRVLEGTTTLTAA